MFGKPENRQLVGRLLALSQVGAEMAAPPAVGALIDYKLGSSPWCVIVGAVLGLVGGLVHLVLLSQPQPGEKRPDKKDVPE